MKRKLGSLFVGAGAVALAVLGIPAATAIAGATTPSGTRTFQVANTGTTVLTVGTTHFTPTETALGGHAAASGAHVLPSNLSSVPLPKVPDVGKGDSLAGTGGVRGTASPRGHLKAVTAQGVTNTAGGATSTVGINGFAEGILHPTPTHSGLPGVDVEPPDQGLCANSTYVMEVNNEVMQVWHGGTPASANGMALEKLFTAPEIFGSTGKSGINVQGDPRCQWDPTSGRWFATQIWLTESGNTSQFGWSGVFVAVSATTDPTGTWTVYFVPDMTDVKASTGCNNLPATTLPFVKTGGTANPCFGDQPLLGMNTNAVYLTTNEYSIFSTTVGGVANVYFLSKADLLSGTPSPIYWSHAGNMVTRPTAGKCPFGQPTTVHCPFYSIVPALSDGTYVPGTINALSNVTFTTTGGHQVALWQFTNTTAVTGSATAITASVAIATVQTYTEPPYATQKAGTVPLGTLWNKFQAKGAHGRKLAKEGVLATNTDRVTTAAYDPSTGKLWGAMNTGVAPTGAPEAGIEWFSLSPSGSGTSLAATTAASGYVSASGMNVMFPAIAFTNAGAGLMDFSMSGPSYYPSTGYTTVGATGPTSTIHVSFLGKGPQDGFSEYTWGYHRPRWGDYSAAVASTTTFHFATEAIGQTCSVPQFEHTFSCGGTRDLFINWGTSVNTLPAG